MIYLFHDGIPNLSVDALCAVKTRTLIYKTLCALIRARVLAFVLYWLSVPKYIYYTEQTGRTQRVRVLFFLYIISLRSGESDK